MNESEVRAAMEEIRGQMRKVDPARTTASLTGRKYDVYNLLIDLGCNFEQDGDQRVPVPVLLGSLSIDLILDEGSAPGVVVDRNQNGDVWRTYVEKDGVWTLYEFGAPVHRFDHRVEA